MRRLLLGTLTALLLTAGASQAIQDKGVKVLIITGSTGIGASAARQAALEGARLLIATQDELSGMELASETEAVSWIGDLLRPRPR